MAPKIFLTGITGYIGGDIYYLLDKKHPDWSYSVLVRTQDKADQVAKAYPKARIAIGELDDSVTIKDESAKADIVIHTADASDHEGAAKAIAEGLASGHTRPNPGYWLHTGGTGILTYSDADAERYGEATDKIYDDWEKVEELTGLPDHAFHRNVDKVVLDAGIKNADTVKTAIVCPPTIYGQGRGPISTRSRQTPVLAATTLRLQKAPILGRGLTYWNNVHVHDLSELFVLLAEAAAARNDDPRLWGEKGYFLAENGEHVWGELSKHVAKVAADKGYIPTAETQPMKKDEAFDTAGFEALSWGMNSRGVSRRARVVLGWKPSSPSLEDEMPKILDVEYNRRKEEK